MSNPKKEYRTIVHDSGGRYVNRLMVGTAATGLVRMEWVGARYGQIIPTNWSYVEMRQFLDSYIPLRYQVADAQNLIVQEAINRGFEWLLLLEHDVVMPPDTFIRLNEYITRMTAPVISGLYFTRSMPSEPLIYRGRGTGSYRDFHLGDKVYCDGVPTGILLIDCQILKLMYEDAPEYMISYYGGEPKKARAVFDTPRDLWFNPESRETYSQTGTSDLNWCTRIMDGDYMRRAGWEDYLDKLPDKRYPFLVDTNIFCQHINPDGQTFPGILELGEYVQLEPATPPSLSIHVGEQVNTEDIFGGG